MAISSLDRRLLIWLLLAIWSLIGSPTLVNILTRSGPMAVRGWLWIGAFALVGGALVLTARGGFAERRRRIDQWLVVVQGAAVLVMTACVPCYLACILSAAVAWQAALVFSLRTALVGLGAHTLVLGWVFLVVPPSGPRWTDMGSHLAFQGLAIFSAFAARKEAEGRRELVRVNVELQATRGQLADASRAAERLRITRELHDVLGHNLAALSLQLEVATHQATGAAVEPVARARELSRALLSNVREVVSAFREDEAVDLRAELAKLVEGVERPRPHVSLDAALMPAHPLQAHTVLRCVQEMVTNVLKHSGAQNLWVEVMQTPAAILARVRDDGRGAAALIEGHGLAGMRERLERLGGALEVQSVPGSGLSVTAEVPRGRAAA